MHNGRGTDQRSTPKLGLLAARNKRPLPALGTAERSPMVLR